MLDGGSPMKKNHGNREVGIGLYLRKAGQVWPPRESDIKAKFQTGGKRTVLQHQGKVCTGPRKTSTKAWGGNQVSPPGAGGLGCKLQDMGSETDKMGTEGTTPLGHWMGPVTFEVGSYRGILKREMMGPPVRMNRVTLVGLFNTLQ